eukprot:12801217-Alexandrium_andersonii.AAC.1
MQKAINVQARGGAALSSQCAPHVRRSLLPSSRANQDRGRPSTMAARQRPGGPAMPRKPHIWA